MNLYKTCYQDMEHGLRKAMEEFSPGVKILFCGTHVFRAWEVFLQKNALLIYRL